MNKIKYYDIKTARELLNKFYRGYEIYFVTLGEKDEICNYYKNLKYIYSNSEFLNHKFILDVSLDNDTLLSSYTNMNLRDLFKSFLK